MAKAFDSTTVATTLFSSSSKGKSSSADPVLFRTPVVCQDLHSGACVDQRILILDHAPPGPLHTLDEIRRVQSQVDVLRRRDADRVCNLAEPACTVDREGPFCETWIGVWNVERDRR